MLSGLSFHCIAIQINICTEFYSIEREEKKNANVTNWGLHLEMMIITRVYSLKRGQINQNAILLRNIFQ